MLRCCALAQLLGDRADEGMRALMLVQQGVRAKSCSL